MYAHKLGVFGAPTVMNHIDTTVMNHIDTSHNTHRALSGQGRVYRRLGVTSTEKPFAVGTNQVYK